VLAVLCLALPEPTGRAVRRRGDWWVGQSEGWVAQQVRAGLGRAGRWIEQRGAPPPEPMFAALPPTPPPPPLPDPEVPLPLPEPRPHAGAWLHPYHRRVLPPNAVCRFGAFRPGRRPAECELGHCGVDLPAKVGTPVYAVQAGVVLKAERDERRGGRAGRYVKLAHRDGAVRSWYVHLDQIDPRIQPGAEVTAGQRLGTIGLTGVKISGPHPHFALALKRGKRYRYVDPEPLLWIWPPAKPEPRPAVASLTP
jgi:murein DD-endopeptidase MepM/ murein hydrolase activator NlpD